MIEFVLPVQIQMTQRRDSQLQLQSKEEDNSFSKKMNEKLVKKNDSQQTEKNEPPKEIKQCVQEGSKLQKKELPVLKEEAEEKKSTEELLVAVSEQILAIQQLHAQPELLYQYIQKLQELCKTYGNIKLNELPPNELQKLVSFVKDLNIQNTVCLEETIQMTLDKLAPPEKMMEFAKNVQSETCDLMKKDLPQEVTTVLKKEEKAKPIELGDTDVQLITREHDVKQIFSGNDQVVKENIQTQKVSLPELGKKMEAQVEELQKFVVRQERVLFQLNPEKLGTLTVYMKKQGDQIEVHVERDKQDGKKRVELSFDELKTKVRDEEIHIELSYTDKDQKRERHEREQPHKPKQVVVREEQKAEQDFAGLLEE